MIDKNKIPTIRALLLGDSAVGKSCLLLRYCNGKFDSNFVITIGVDFKSKKIEISGNQYQLQVWDTAGQERFRTITPAYYRGTMGVLLVFDVTDHKSFLNVETWMKNLDKYADVDVQKIIVGNKSDLPKNMRKVSTEDAQRLADKYGIPFIEVSAKNDINVSEAFNTLAKMIAETRGLLVQEGTGIDLGGEVSASRKCCKP